MLVEGFARIHQFLKHTSWKIGREEIKKLGLHLYSTHCFTVWLGRYPKGLVTEAAVNRKKEISADNERDTETLLREETSIKKHVSGMNTENVQ